MKECIKCSKPIEATSKTGRPAVYCSTACRRLAEYEINRINKRLANLEDQLIYEKMGKDNAVNSQGLRRDERIAALTAAIDDNEARLKELLADTGE